MAATVCAAMPAVACSQQRASSSGQRMAFRPFSRALAAKPLVQQQAAAPAVARRAVAVSAAAAAAPAQQKIRIKLKSYWVDLLADSVEKIREAASSTGATIAGPVPLPTRCVWPPPVRARPAGGVGCMHRECACTRRSRCRCACRRRLWKPAGRHAWSAPCCHCVLLHALACLITAAHRMGRLCQNAHCISRAPAAALMG